MSFEKYDVYSYVLPGPFTDIADYYQRFCSERNRLRRSEIYYSGNYLSDERIIILTLSKHTRVVDILQG